MNKLIGIAGDTAAVAGVLLCMVAGAARIFGNYEIGGIGTIALLTAGIGLMVFACLAKLHLLALRQKGEGG